VRSDLKTDAPDSDEAQALASLDDPDWHKSSETSERLRKTLMPYAAYYLTSATQEREAADSVARFHLGNGARLERLNWLADASPRGLQQSAGMMVNYLYRPEEVEQNHEVYVRERKVAASRDLRRLAAECVLAQRPQSA
jgi:malonyl-CoA decarboxylase